MAVLSNGESSLEAKDESSYYHMKIHEKMSFLDHYCRCLFLFAHIMEENQII
jgi:hypothetical protein